LGAATADALYASLAGLGLTFITHALVQEQAWFRVGGAVFLFYLGARIFFRPPASQEMPSRSAPLFGSYFTTFFLTITNPLTILSFAAVFAGLGIQESRAGYAAAGIWILGVFVGSTLWWYILSLLANSLRNKMSPKYLKWINRISGSIIFAFGLWALLS
jgi:threonine/homoserine/homoserine lactone efflux protein